jgi:uncharacterized membrane protein
MLEKGFKLSLLRLETHIAERLNRHAHAVFLLFITFLAVYAAKIVRQISRRQFFCCLFSVLWL